MTYRVRLTSEARRQLLEIDAWWAANRSGAPVLLATELARAVSLLSTMPGLGKAYRGATAEPYRRLLLRRSRFHLYYSIDEGARTVMISAVWSAVRGHGPSLP